MKLTDQDNKWEKFTVEVSQNGKYSLKQVVSGLYLGGNIANNTSPLLVQNNQDWEKFNLESRGNGKIVIRSHANTYLVRENDGIAWKLNPEGGRELWNFNVASNQGNQQFDQQFHQSLGSHLAQGFNQGQDQNQGFRHS